MTRQPISRTTRFEVFKRDKFTCQYCGRKAPDVVLHVDHIHPVAQGGGNDLLNLEAAFEAGGTADDLGQIARRERSWSSWQDAMYDYIDRLRDGDA